MVDTVTHRRCEKLCSQKVVVGVGVSERWREGGVTCVQVSVVGGRAQASIVRQHVM